MKPRLRKTAALLCLALACLALSACSSTRTENGVTIEEGRSYNPLNYIPGL